MPPPTPADGLGACARGAAVWVQAPSAPDVWAPATLAAAPGEGETVAVVLEGEAEPTTVPASCVAPANPASLDGAHDVTALTFLNEAAVLHGLRQRHARDEIYTLAGPVLVAVNPFQALPIYGDAAAAAYAAAATAAAFTPGKATEPLPPHVYGVAGRAWAAVAARGAHQAVVVSGESGAGKTETAKLALAQLARLAGGGRVGDAVLASNPLLEAFGNAATRRNANSSRFGKLVVLAFDGKARVTGARVSTFLLEKSRVSARPAGERSFHALHYLVAGAAAERGERERLHLSEGCEAGFFKYLADTDGGVGDDGLGGGRRGPSAAPPPGAAPRHPSPADDAAGYASVNACMADLGITSADAADVWALLAGVLWLGNVEFEAGPDDGAVATPGPALPTAASLLGVPAPALAASLTSRQLLAGGEAVTARRSPASAASARDALARAVYAGVFDWVVARVNAALAEAGKGSAKGERGGGGAAAAASAPPPAAPPAPPPLDPAAPTLALLDIYGFETFGDDNGFEQLCINYANEHLQAQFNRHMLRLEQDEYAAEGVGWDRVAWTDNAPVLAALDVRPPAGLGVFALLDEACVVPGGCDAAFGLRVAAEHGGASGGGDGGDAHPPGPVRACPRRGGARFDVSHSAGLVSYATPGFLDRNRDVVAPEAAALLGGSARPVARGVAAGAAALAARRGGGATVASSFREQLRELVGLLDRCELHFVRCIKPNVAAAPRSFDGPLVAHQLRCSGVAEVARVARAGFPSRLPYADVVERFGELARAGRVGGGTDGAHRDAVAALLAALGVPPSDYALGETKLFLRPGVLGGLEAALHARTAAATTLQAGWRGAVARRSFLRTRRAAVTVQATWRGVGARRAFVQSRSAAVAVQAAWRGASTRRALARTHAAATRIALAWRRAGLRARVAARAAVRSEGRRVGKAAAAGGEGPEGGAVDGHEAGGGAAAPSPEIAERGPAAGGPKRDARAAPARPDPVGGTACPAMFGGGDGAAVAPGRAAAAAPPRAASTTPPSPSSDALSAPGATPAAGVAAWERYSEQLEEQLKADLEAARAALAAARAAAGAAAAGGARLAAAAAGAAALVTVSKAAADLERKAALFTDDAVFLEEVSRGLVAAPGLHLGSELRTLRTRFENFVRDFKAQLDLTAEAVREACGGPKRGLLARLSSGGHTRRRPGGARPGSAGSRGSPTPLPGVGLAAAKAEVAEQEAGGGIGALRRAAARGGPRAAWLPPSAPRRPAAA